MRARLLTGELHREETYARARAPNALQKFNRADFNRAEHAVRPIRRTRALKSYRPNPDLSGQCPPNRALSPLPRKSEGGPEEGI
jgi:hypothetical protein